MKYQNGIAEKKTINGKPFLQIISKDNEKYELEIDLIVEDWGWYYVRPSPGRFEFKKTIKVVFAAINKKVVQIFINKKQYYTYRKTKT